MSSKTLTVKAAGLFLSPNELGSIPDGALSQADNVVIRADNIIECRRGTKVVSTKTLKKLRSWKGILIGHDGGSILSRSNVAVDAWTDYSESCISVSGWRIELAEGGGDLYITTSGRPKRLDAITGILEDQSIQPVSGMKGMLVNVGGTALPPLKTVGYRCVFGKYDSNGRLILGQPSGRSVVSNVSAVDTYDLSPFYAIPVGLPVGTFIRAYRTESVANGIDPGEEYGLTVQETVIREFDADSAWRDPIGGLEVRITASTPHGWPVAKLVWIYWVGDVVGPPSFTAGYYSAIVLDANTISIGTGVPGTGTGTAAFVKTITPVATSFGVGFFADGKDTVPDGYLGAALYTNPSQGRGMADAAVPIYGAKHIESYQGACFFGDITYPSRFDLYLLAVAGTNGLVANDTITINGLTYTAKTTSANYTLREFSLYTTGTPAENIRDTIQSLCMVLNINRDTSVYARSGSGVDDVPGFCVIEEDDIATTLTVVVSRPGAWSIQNLKGPERIKNEIRWSLNQQPDMTPVVDYARLGNADSEILREVATRNAMFIFKEDGLFILRGTTSPWTIELLDPSVILTAPESAVVLDNQIYCLTTRGVMRVSETGVVLLSRPIESALENLDPDDVSDLAFGVGYEEDHSYLLWIPTDSLPGQCQGAYVYDVYTDTWVHRTDPANFATIHNRMLYVADGTVVRQERKLWTEPGDQDYELADDEYAVSVTVGGTLVTSATLADATNVAVGDALVQGSSIAIVTAKAGNVLTLDRAQTWTVAAATSYRAIACSVQWSPRLAGDPSDQHRFMEASVLFRNVYFAQAALGLASAHDPTLTTLSLLGSEYGWTGAKRSRFALRALVDRLHAVSTTLDVSFAISQAICPWKIEGLSIRHRTLSGRTGR